MKISNFNNEYSFLSNYYSCQVFYEGMKFLSAETAFQAAKTCCIGERNKFVNLQPNEAKKLGRKIKLRVDWEDIKQGVMYACLKSKFSDPALKQKLLDTGDAELEEGNWWNDTYWGICNGVGENHLGKLLMKLRKELAKENIPK
jgi:hypothetical protein